MTSALPMPGAIAADFPRLYPMSCPLCGLVMESAEVRNDWHGLGSCAMICALCDGQGKHKNGKKCTRCNGKEVEIREIAIERS